MYVQLPGTPPRHSDVDDRAEEEEEQKLVQAALHRTILRHFFPSFAAAKAARHSVRFGQAVYPITTFQAAEFRLSVYDHDLATPAAVRVRAYFSLQPTRHAYTLPKP